MPRPVDRRLVSGRARATPAAVVRDVLQGYADRGVFRGLVVREGGRGRLVAEFVWLLRRPMTMTFDPVRAVLQFPRLMPGVGRDPAIVADLETLIAERTGRGVPAHKRVDARRARLSSRVARGDLSMGIAVRGDNHEYALRRLLNLINELFLLLHETYPDYLVAEFGLSTE